GRGRVVVAVSPLGSAMMGNDAYNGLIPRDPAYMPAARKLAFAQSLMEQGSSQAPAYPLQGLARALTGGIGALMYNSGQSDFSDVTKAQSAASQANTAGLFGPGGLLSGGGGSASPGMAAAPQGGMTPAVQPAPPP